jgi:hypothetical protein
MTGHKDLNAVLHAIDIEDEDITFDGQPLSALFEQTRYSYGGRRECEVS